MKATEQAWRDVENRLEKAREQCETLGEIATDLGVASRQRMEQIRNQWIETQGRPFLPCGCRASGRTQRVLKAVHDGALEPGEIVDEVVRVISGKRSRPGLNVGKNTALELLSLIFQKDYAHCDVHQDKP